MLPTTGPLLLGVLLLLPALLTPFGPGVDGAPKDEEKKSVLGSLLMQPLSTSSSTLATPLFLNVGFAALELLYVGQLTRKANILQAKKDKEEKKKKDAEVLTRKKEIQDLEEWASATRAQKHRLFREREARFKAREAELIQRAIVQGEQLAVIEKHQAKSWEKYLAWLQRPEIKPLLSEAILAEISSPTSPLAQVLPLLVLAQVESSQRPLLDTSFPPTLLPISDPIGTVTSTASAPLTTSAAGTPADLPAKIPSSTPPLTQASPPLVPAQVGSSQSPLLDTSFPPTLLPIADPIGTVTSTASAPLTTSVVGAPADLPVKAIS